MVLEDEPLGTYPNSACSNRPRFYPEPEYVNPECGACEFVCCSDHKQCLSICPQLTAAFIAVHFLTFMLAFRNFRAARRAGNGWLTLKVWVLCNVMLLSGSAVLSDSLRLIFREQWQQPKFQAWSMLVTIAPSMAISCSLTYIVYQWATALVRVESKKSKSRFHIIRILSLIATGVVIPAAVFGSFALDHIPLAISKLILVGVRAMAMIFFGITVLTTSRKVRAIIETAGATEAGKAAMARLNAMTKRASVAALMAAAAIFLAQVFRGRSDSPEMCGASRLLVRLSELAMAWTFVRCLRQVEPTKSTAPVQSHSQTKV